MIGRVSIQPRHLADSLPEDDGVAVECLETHFYLRTRGPNPAFEVFDDGTRAICKYIGATAHAPAQRASTPPRKPAADVSEVLWMIAPAGLPSSRPGGGA